jgi:hypothetical protein
MISTMPVCAPAGVSGPGGLVLRAVVGTRQWPVAVRLRALGTAVADVRVPTIAPTGVRIDGTAVPAAPQHGTTREQFLNDGTTLGLQSPGRPPS